MKPLKEDQPQENASNAPTTEDIVKVNNSHLVNSLPVFHKTITLDTLSAAFGQPLSKSNPFNEAAPPSTTDNQSLKCDSLPQLGRLTSPLPDGRTKNSITLVELDTKAIVHQPPSNITVVSSVNTSADFSAALSSSLVRPDQLQYVSSVKNTDLSSICTFISQISHNSEQPLQNNDENLICNELSPMRDGQLSNDGAANPRSHIPACSFSNTNNCSSSENPGSSFSNADRPSGSKTFPKTEHEPHNNFDKITIKQEPVDNLPEEECKIVSEERRGRKSLRRLKCKPENDSSPSDISFPTSELSSAKLSKVKKEENGSDKYFDSEEEDFKDIYRTDIHNRKSLPLHHCSICGKKYPRKTTFRKHLCIKCVFCGQRYQDKSALLHHLEMHENHSTFTCGKCSKQFRDIKSYHEHRRRHTGDRKYTCTICGMMFSLKWFLLRHELVHMGLKPQNCKFCHMTFAFKSTLQKHCQQQHYNEILHRCTLCNRTFSRQNLMINHLLAHTDKKPFQCVWCPKHYTSKVGLDKHRHKHLDNIAAGLRLPTHHSGIQPVSYSAHLSASVKANLKLKQRLGKGKNPSKGIN